MREVNLSDRVPGNTHHGRDLRIWAVFSAFWGTISLKGIQFYAMQRDPLIDMFEGYWSRTTSSGKLIIDAVDVVSCRPFGMHNPFLLLDMHVSLRLARLHAHPADVSMIRFFREPVWSPSVEKPDTKE